MYKLYAVQLRVVSKYRRNIGRDLVEATTFTNYLKCAENTAKHPKILPGKCCSTFRKICRKLGT